MDFNMWMQDGIPYVTGETARYLMTKFEERYEKKREDEGKKESPTKKKPVRSCLVQAAKRLSTYAPLKTLIKYSLFNIFLNYD
jgi:hypothetical protein